MIPIFLGLLILLVDQAIKTAVRNDSMWLFGPLQIKLVENDGLVFSIPAPLWISLALMIVAVSGIGVMLWSKRRMPAVRLPAVLLMVGAVSNVYDRIVHGAITDYLYVSLWLPIMNLADIAILVGLIVLIIRRHELDVRRR